MNDLSSPAQGAASIRDVALLAHVSAGTVSNALNHPEKVRSKTRADVEEAVQKLGFVRNDAARQLRHGSSTTVGIIVPDVGNPFFLDIARGAERRAEEAGFSLVIGNTDFSEEREARYIAAFEQQRVRGLIVAPVAGTPFGVATMRSRGIPVVLIGPPSYRDNFPSVYLDDIEGGRVAVDHLIDQGCRKIAFVGGPSNIPQVASRLAGARASVAARPQAVLRNLPTEGLNIADGRHAARRILAKSAAERPDGLFAANDLLAIGLIQTLNFGGAGMVPNQMMVIGYDDVGSPLSESISLSSIRQPAAEMGERAMNALLIPVDDHPDGNVTFRPELVVRESTSLAAAKRTS